MKPREIGPHRFNEILSNALKHNVLKLSPSINVNYASKCEKPFIVRLYCWIKQQSGGLGRRHMEIETRCRKCSPCLKARKHFWTDRIAKEFATWGRTWAGTMTIRPTSRVRYCYKADVIPGHYSDDDYKKLCKVIGKDLTNFIKRLRKNTKAKIRYFSVFEKHKDGFPHVHVLIHECTPVSKRALEKEWVHGFTRWKLVKDRKGAIYVAKYLTKAAGTRIRASGRYGTPLGLVAPTGGNVITCEAWQDPYSYTKGLV